MDDQGPQSCRDILRSALDVFEPRRHLPPFIYFLLSIFSWNNFNEHVDRIILFDFILIYLLFTRHTIFINFDTATIILFFMWILENKNRTALKTNPDLFATNDDFFLIFSLYFFKIALWGLTVMMACFIVILLFRIIRHIILGTLATSQIVDLKERLVPLTFVKYKDYEAEHHQAPLGEVAKHTVAQKKEMNEICSICLGNYHEDDQVYLMPACHHLFHANCITDWYASNKICPYCRTPMSPTEIEMKPVSEFNDLEAQRHAFRGAYAPPGLLLSQNV